MAQASREESRKTSSKKPTKSAKDQIEAEESDALIGEVEALENLNLPARLKIIPDRANEEWHAKCYNAIALSYNAMDPAHEYEIKENFDFDYSCTVAINLITALIKNLDDDSLVPYFEKLLDLLKALRHGKFLRKLPEPKK